ncbi:DUF6723 family protein, partial [Caballeronia glathei]
PPSPGLTPDDFAIYASNRRGAAAEYYGTLKVVRKTDGRLLYPFEGAPTIGPFSSRARATEAAEQLGLTIVMGDIARPEL